MNNRIIASLCLSVLCSVGMNAAFAKSKSANSELNRHIAVCKHKQVGDAVSYSAHGITFNGTCQPQSADNSKKLIFQAPQPAAGTVPVKDTQISKTSSAPQPVTDAPAEAPTTPSPAQP